METEDTSSINNKRMDLEPVHDDTPRGFVLPIAQETRSTLQVVCNEVYSDQDVVNWRVGADRYNEFLGSLLEDTRSIITHAGAGPLQAVFLKEKPAYLASSSLVDAPGLKSTLLKVGLQCDGLYIYDSKEVQRTLAAYPDECSGFPTSSPDAFMRAFASTPLDQCTLLRGLILGFPKSSVIAYVRQDAMPIHDIAKRLHDILSEHSDERVFMEREWFGNRRHKEDIVRFFTEQLKRQKSALRISDEEIPELLEQVRHLLNVTAVNIQGNIWADYIPSAESRRKQQRLCAAFERSGILNSL